MSKYITRRLLLVIPLALGITFINFAMYNAAPGDPILMLINPEERYTLSEEQIEYFRHKLGLDQPLPIRYVKWLGRIVRGDMGYSVSVQPGHQVSELIWRSLPQTIELMVIGLFVSTTVGIGLGVLAALRPYTLLDYASTAFAFTFMAIPSFFFSMLLIFVFAIKFDLFPTSGIITPEDPATLGNHLRHLVLPSLATSLGFGGMMRYARNAMLEVLGQDYVTTARAKGLQEKVVILRHTFKNALLPVVNDYLVGVAWADRGIGDHRVDFCLARDGTPADQRCEFSRLSGHDGGHSDCRISGAVRQSSRRYYVCMDRSSHSL